MSERLSPDGGAPACPFVAFEDDRGRRSVAPDHRHRCFAELRPAPRALGHQEAYCLSASFAGCPTFEDWARRQAAREVAAGARDVETVGTMAGEGEMPVDAPSPAEPRAARRPRDWTAPPPWALDRAPSTHGDQLGAFDSLEEAPPPLREPTPHLRVEGDPEVAALLRPAAGPPAPASGAADDDEGEVPAFLAGRGGASRSGRPAAGRPMSQAHPVAPKLRRPAMGDPDAPSWERPRHFEAYPTLRARASIPRLPGIVLALVALSAAALLVFFLPSLLTAPAATPTPSPTAAPAATPALPTEVPSPTAQVYVVVSGDSISKIATQFGLTQEELLAANPRIKDPDKIAIGDEVVIPAPATPVPSPSDAASPSP